MIFFVFLPPFLAKTCSFKYGHKDLDAPAVKLMTSQLERGGTSQEVISSSGVYGLTWFVRNKMMECL